MTVDADDVAGRLIEEAANLIRRKADSERASQAEAFVRRYYARVPSRDLQERSVADVYGAAMAHWNLANQRRPAEPKVRVYTPDLEQHGWQSTHSVVEIVTDDMPFLVDSVTMELTRRELGIHLVIYPTMPVRRDEGGTLVAVGDDAVGDGGVESFIHVEIDRQSKPAILDDIRQGLLHILGHVRAAVDDWQPMRERLHEIVDEFERQPPPIDPHQIAEARRFLQWLDDNHFTFLSCRTYDMRRGPDGDVLVSQPGTGLGILRGAPKSEKRFADQPPEVRELARARNLLILTKANSRATVHRPSYLDYVGIKRLGPDGEPVGEWRFLGLYASDVYSGKAQDIPVIRDKIAAVLERAGFPPNSHDAKDLLAILESYPRDELFDTSTTELFEIAMGILGLQERRHVRLFIRRDRFGRYLSCLVFVPRDRFNTKTRLKIQEVLTEAFDATGLDYSIRFAESVLARLHCIVHIRPGVLPAYDVIDVERRIAEAIRTWPDELAEALVDEFGEERGTQSLRIFEEAFPPGYRDDHPARVAVTDIERLEGLRPDGDLAMALYRPIEAPHGYVRLKLYRSGTPITLSDVLPLLENMGVHVTDERPYGVTPAGGTPLWIYDFGLRYEGPGELESEDIKRLFLEAFEQVWMGACEDDGYNRLVLGAGLGWRDIALLRAYSMYLRQTGTRFSPSYMEDALVENPRIARLLRDLFHERFDPARGDSAQTQTLEEEIAESLEEVASLDTDRILRSFHHLVAATLRTNYFARRPDHEAMSHLSLKLDPRRIPDLPLPRPAVEIFVYSPRTEGVHLRGGEVARGGLRWSDRREDFRTEVLGLMKAQNVKNAVIVPVGAKGGFVVKAPPGTDPQAHRREVEECYRIFVRGLLDVTDNILGGSVVPPEGVVRYDGDDPYLVVAADKGTATFSDTANAIAEEVGFWLGDAFASGGSAGYDHKAMGITARGAWESVKRHFRELGTDIQTADFTVVGIGDMSGDVFGNGMLLSRHVRLVGAFDHRHVFLDPDPDAATSFGERERLFALPRSTWADYNADLISKGGGVWPRTAKSIPLSEQAQRLLAVSDEALTPDGVISALLRAPVDLLFNGGVGTFVKASNETHADVGDKASERIRINAADLRCKVVGEGGNLGFTQRARVEYAIAGGRISTDAIDNSAGVDCSDHEVNIKILLDAMVAADDLTRKQRNELLVEMTEEVAALVLEDNYAQAQAISSSLANAASMVDVHRRYLHHLEVTGKLDRELEFLPSDEELVERRNAGRGLVRPEFAVLLAYSKSLLYEELLDSDVPEDPWLVQELERYFPTALRARYAKQMQAHRLRREIIATQVANSIVNEAGTTFVFRLTQETGAEATDIARAFMIAREVFDLRGLQAQVRELDNRVPAAVQTRMLLEGRRLVERGTRWLLRKRRRPIDIEGSVSFFAPGVAAVADLMPALLRAAERQSVAETQRQFEDKDVPAALAERVACLPPLFSALDLVRVADAVAEPVPVVAEMYFALAERLHLGWLREQIVALPRDTRWHALARDALREDFYAQHSALTAEVLGATDAGAPVAERVAEWARRNAGQVRRCEHLLAEIENVTTADLAALSVGLREIRTLVTAAV